MENQELEPMKKEKSLMLSGFPVKSVSHNQQSKENAFRSARALVFWEQMIGFYGKKWIDSFGEHPNQVWISAIDFLTDSQIEYGFKGCLNSASGWPPGLPEFLSWAKEPTYDDLVTY